MLRRFTNKYHAKRTEVDGINFASKAEARHYTELKQLQLAGEIRDLGIQVSFPLHVNAVKIGAYRADFVYLEKPDGELTVTDVKGFKTPLYNWKKKHVLAEYGIEIREVR